ncbi:unnamed protein product [Fraxinus pennsylvanica]|uniref:Uncharacterized protein n=1 Tax=Fraxinus pennsylvanica TaxID=56036 RepID=A0AAD2A1L1_9LAMI|nr:unnamed protein product [Fraxinus pennsylvanica]
MGCGISRFHLHDEDAPLNCKSNELPETYPGSIHSLVKNGDEMENQNHEKEEEVINGNVGNKKLVGQDKDREINYKGNIEKKLRIHNDEEEEDDEREGERISDVNGWIGSPSFREYCVDCKSEDGFKGNEDADEREIEIRAGDKIKLSNVVHVTEKRRGRRFIKVFPMHRSSGVRNFLNVSTCYNPNASSYKEGHTKSLEKKIIDE